MSQENMPTKFYNVGLSYKKADVKVRGAFSVTKENQKLLLKEAKEKGVDGIFVDRKSVVQGKSVDHGGRRNIKKKKNKKKQKKKKNKTNIPHIQKANISPNNQSVGRKKSTSSSHNHVKTNPSYKKASSHYNISSNEDH